MRSPVAAVTILSLMLLAVCCQILPSMHMHDAMESVPELAVHFVLLTLSVPTSVFACALILAEFLRLTTNLPARLRNGATTPQRFGRPPDPFCITPLRLAIADGILSPKGY